MVSENANDKLKKWLEHFNELPELQCAYCGVVFKGSHECDYILLKEKVKKLQNELNGFELSNQSLSNSLDKEIKENEQLKHLNEELSGCLEWHIKMNEQYEKALKAYGDEEGKLILKDLEEMEKFLKNQVVKGRLAQK